MNKNTLARAVISISVFLAVTIFLYVIYQNEFIPFFLFIIGFGITILISAFILINPNDEKWEELIVIPVKRRRK